MVNKISISIGVGWLMVVVAGLFVPLMDNDSAHHANIALRMYLSGDYVSLVDYNGPYLDKPHLHFWLSALSFHLFGVTGFAYKLPSLLFSLIGIWSVYRTGCLMINERAGTLSSIIYASSAAVLLSLNDVRMDAILSSCVAISIWQLSGYIKSGGYKYVLGAGLGVGLGFCTKGHIGVLIPALFALSLAYRTNRWRKLFSINLLWGILVFLVVVSPVVYCYYLQYNLHPELVVRGKNHIDGVRFILWEQSLGRYSGEMGGDAQGDKLFFFHTFLWVFAPWSLIGVLSLLRRRASGGVVAKTVLPILLIFGVLVGFSSFKLPHYLNVILPLSSLWVGEVLLFREGEFKKITIAVLWLLWLLAGLLMVLVLMWWFPEQSSWFWVGLMVSFVLLFYINFLAADGLVYSAVYRIATAVLLIFWVLNAAFYPNLLKHQGGNVLANHKSVLGIKDSIYSAAGFYSSSFYFYSGSIRKEVTLEGAKDSARYLILDATQLHLLDSVDEKWNRIDSVVDYEITKISGTFLNPSSRDAACTHIYLLGHK